MKKNIQFYKNIFYNIISHGLVLGVLQLIVFPIMSRNYGVDKFGQIISLYGISMVINGALIGSLTRLRIIYNKKVKSSGIFSSFLLLSLIFVLISTLISILFYGVEATFLENLFLIIFTFLYSFRLYYTTFFQTALKYKYIIILDIFVVVGYFIGLIVFKFLLIWPIVLIIGEMCGIIYIIINKYTSYEKPVFNNELKSMTKEYVYLVFSSSIATSLNYLDRFLIPIIIGLNSLSIYYTSRIIPKMLTLIITPLLNVVLSYLTNSEDSSNNDKIKIIRINFYLCIVMIPVYLVINFISPYIIQMLYPDIYGVAINFIPMGTTIVIFQILSNINNTFLLSISKMSAQVVVHVIFLIFYLILAVIGSILYNLHGFMISSIIAYVIKWLVLVLSIKIILDKKEAVD